MTTPFVGIAFAVKGTPAPQGSKRGFVVNGLPAISPDCGDPYKHRACTGDAWDHYNDQPAPCECDCHLEAK